MWNWKRKSWRCNVAIMSVSTILIIALYFVHLKDTGRPDPVKQEEEGGKQTSIIKTRLTNLSKTHVTIGMTLFEEMLRHRQMLGSLNDSLPKLQEQIKGLQEQLQGCPNNKQQQQQSSHTQPNRTSTEDFIKRRQRVNYVCSTGQVSGNVRNVMTNRRSGVIYCIVPKAGCTFWERIFTAVNSPIDEEIENISYYNFHHFYIKKTLAFYEPCITPKEIAYRLWNNFRWRGYIDTDVHYKLPEQTDLKDIEADFMIQVRAARKSGLQNPKKMKAAKQEFKKKAFSSISKDMFEKLGKKYALDFDLFGYTELRDEIYSYYSS